MRHFLFALREDPKAKMLSLWEDEYRKKKRRACKFSLSTSLGVRGCGRAGTWVGDSWSGGHFGLEEGRSTRNKTLTETSIQE